MIRSIQRLQIIKLQQKAKSSQKMIFLLNPKDTRILQALVAWRSINMIFDKEALIQEDATIEALWELNQFSVREYAITLGCTVQDALPRLKQLKNLSLIYPDGTINQNARVLVNMHIKKKLSQVRTSDERD